MKRTLVISDIHGELELFNALLEKVKYDATEDQLILLGDYIDRGPDSKGVLNRVMELKSKGAIVLRGNHDEMMVHAMDDEPKARDRWARNNGTVTLKNYDSSIGKIEMPDSELFRTHVDFIRSLDYFHETDDYIFVHGGVEPDVPVSKSDPYRLIWIREEFYLGYKGEKTVVYGHTPTSILLGKGNHNVYFGENNVIGIDGAAAYGGRLNCLELPSKDVYYTSKRTN